MGAVEIPDRVHARIWERIDERGPAECWPSSWSTGSHGYAQIGWRKGKTRYATVVHRIVYEQRVGPIPEGQTIDHICRNKICQNPEHFILLTNVDNACDNGQARRTQCPFGHPYDGPNTYIDKRGHRKCRMCRKRWR